MPKMLWNRFKQTWSNSVDRNSSRNYCCSIPGRFKIHSFRRRRRSTSYQKLVQSSGVDCDLRLQKCFRFCSSGQTMVHTSEKALKWTSDLQDLQAPKRPNDASETANSHTIVSVGWRFPKLGGAPGRRRGLRNAEVAIHRANPRRMRRNVRGLEVNPKRKAPRSALDAQSEVSPPK